MPKAAFCGLSHSESEVYYVKSSTIGREHEPPGLPSLSPAKATRSIKTRVTEHSSLARDWFRTVNHQRGDAGQREDRSAEREQGIPLRE